MKKLLEPNSKDKGKKDLGGTKGARESKKDSESGAIPTGRSIFKSSLRNSKQKDTAK